MRLRLESSLTVGIVMLLVSCSSGMAGSFLGGGNDVHVSPVPTFSDVDQDATDSVIPTPTLSSVYSLPASDEVIIRGHLVLFDPLSTAPEDNGIYLVSIRADAASDVTFAIPQVDDSSYQADVDVTTGDFTFEAVPVGFYALVARTVDSRQLAVRDLTTAQSMFVTVMEDNIGGVLELGDLRLP